MSPMYGHPRSPAGFAVMVVGGALVASVFALFFGWIVMIVWNWIMPDIFGLKVIGYWQGFGLVLLSRLLVGGIGPRGMHGHHGHHGRHGKCGDTVVGHVKKHFGKDCCSNEYEKFWEAEGRAAFEKFRNSNTTTNSNANA